MKKPPAIAACLFGFIAAGTVLTARAAADAAPAQPNACSVVTASKGEGKFTGQISGVNNSMIEVISGNETAVVHYDAGGVQVCEGGIAAPVNRLVQGASVTVYGPMERKGNGFEISATKIVMAGPRAAAGMGNAPVAETQGGMRPINNPALTNGGVKQSGITATDDWNSGAASGGGAAGGSAQMGAAQGRQNSSNSVRIVCNGLQFSVGTKTAPTGMGEGRASTSGVTCRTPVDQTAVQLMQEAMTGRRLASVALSGPNQLDVSLSDAEVSNILFTWDNANEIVEITFSAQRIDVVHQGSGTRATLGMGAVR